MLMTPTRQTVTSATHRMTSTGLGIDLLTGGTNVAATMPVKSAIENCSSSGSSTPKERAPGGEYWPPRRASRSLMHVYRHVHIWCPTRCLGGVDADPLGVHALASGYSYGSSSHHPGADDRALGESRHLGPTLECRRFGLDPGHMARRHVRPQPHRRPPVAARAPGAGRHVRQRSGSDAPVKTALPTFYR